MTRYEITYYRGEELMETIRFERTDDAAAKQRAQEAFRRGDHTDKADGYVLKSADDGRVVDSCRVRRP